METEASTDVEETDDVPDASVPVRAKLITPDAFTHSTSKGTSRPVTISSSSSSSVTLVSGLNTSRASVDELLGSSLSSRLSDTTVRSSNSVSPQGSFSREGGLLTPTSLPLPPSPTVTAAPDPSTVPIPNFQSTPHVFPNVVESGQNSVPSEPFAPVLNSETEASPFDITKFITEKNTVMVGKTPDSAERGEPVSHVREDREIEVSVDDEAKEEGPEELPEAQKPEAEIQEEFEALERKSSSGSSVGERLRPISAHIEEKLVSLEDAGNFKGVPVHADGEAVLNEDTLEEKWGIHFDDEVVPTGRESPESTHALPFNTPAEPSRERTRNSFQIRYTI